MKDLDFDELDRAVNSLIGSPSAPVTPPVPSVNPVAPAPTDSPTPPVDNAPAAPASPQPLAARRSSGRFMDVVHPSSDMRSSAVPSRPAAREGMTVQPISPEPKVEAVAETTPAPEPAVTPKTTDWPDPLDFHGFKDEPLAAKPTDKPADDVDLPDLEAAPPLESPFLPDAKVEKRPLGAFADSPAVEPVPSKVADEPAKPSLDEDENTDRPIGDDTPLPAELQDNLLSIEANEDTSKVSAEPEEPAVQSTMVETMSIPQQYVEKPSTGDRPASGASIFDVEAYRKPAPAKKSKSGWLMVVWIVLLIILGVGAGAGFYFYLLPLL